jgi:hypothetical protein
MVRSRLRPLTRVDGNSKSCHNNWLAVQHDMQSEETAWSSGSLALQSPPRRDQTCTRAPKTSWRRRQPSSLASCIQPSPVSRGRGCRRSIGQGGNGTGPSVPSNHRMRSSRNPTTRLLLPARPVPLVRRGVAASCHPLSFQIVGSGGPLLLPTGRHRLQVHRRRAWVRAALA